MLRVCSWRLWLVILLGIIFLYWIVWGQSKGRTKLSSPVVALPPNISLPEHPTPTIASPRPTSNLVPDEAEVVYIAPTPATLNVSRDEEPEGAQLPPVPCMVQATVDVTPILPNFPQGNHLPPPRAHPSGFISKGQRLACEAIEQIYGVPFEWNVRPNFLKNPETGRNLELDCYNAQLQIGLEYSGKQHYIYPNIFHKSYNEFIEQIRRDQYKVTVCDNAGIYLITVPYNVPYNHIADYVRYYTPEAVAARQPAPIAQQLVV